MALASVPPHHRIAEKIARLGRGRGTLSHSLLIHGSAGSGLADVAHRFGQSVFCETGEGDFGACGSCRNCRRVREGTHPDWIWMVPEQKGKGLPNISIEALRNLQDRMVLEPYEGPKVVGAIFEAEKMRAEAANSLLKLVEEPPQDALFILVTDNRQRILPTIRSRCLPVPVGPPPLEMLAENLAETQRWDSEEAWQAASLSLREGISPQEAVSEEARQFRKEAAHLLSLAVTEGEHAFLPALKARRYEREAMIALLRLFREYLLEAIEAENRDRRRSPYADFNEIRESWRRPIVPDRLADLIDLSIDHEEALLGYVNPTQTIATFLSQVSQFARV